MLKNLCKVNPEGTYYPAYIDWFKNKFPEYFDIYKFISGDAPSEDKTYVWLTSKKQMHYHIPDYSICLILDPEKAQLYVVGSNAIEMVN